VNKNRKHVRGTFSVHVKGRIAFRALRNVRVAIVRSRIDWRVSNTRTGRTRYRNASAPPDRSEENANDPRRRLNVVLGPSDVYYMYVRRGVICISDTRARARTSCPRVDAASARDTFNKVARVRVDKRRRGHVSHTRPARRLGEFRARPRD